MRAGNGGHLGRHRQGHVCAPAARPGALRGVGRCAGCMQGCGNASYLRCVECRARRGAEGVGAGEEARRVGAAWARRSGGVRGARGACGAPGGARGARGVGGACSPPGATARLERRVAASPRFSSAETKATTNDK